MPQMGRIIDSDVQRDAVHVAIAPVHAEERVFPGQRVGLRAGTGDVADPGAEPVGIVDPFLSHPVDAGNRFWLFLFPETVTGLRHEWSHPAFDSKRRAPDAMGESEAWLREFARRCGKSYSWLMDVVEGLVKTGTVFTEQGSSLIRDEYYSNEEEFWKHMRNVADFEIPDDVNDDPFSCWC